MKIQVDCLRSRHGLEPRYFWLGGRRLRVIEILERSAGAAHQVYRVRIEDRREFVLDHDTPSSEWRLVQVCAAPATRRVAPRASSK
jgi:hypothetical protein